MRITLPRFAFVAIASAIGVFSPGHASADPLAPLANGENGETINGAGGIFGESGPASPALGRTGAMTYNIPIVLPPARGKLQPSLNVTYSSSGGDRELGYGWGFDLPSIVRTRLSGFPKYINPPAADFDRFEYAGQPLVFICIVGQGACGPEPMPTSSIEPNSAYFRLQADTTHARFFLNVGSNSDAWIVQFPNGTSFQFGSNYTDALTPNPATDVNDGNPSQVFRWNLSRQIDQSGNVTVYKWQNQGLLASNPSFGPLWTRTYLTDIWESSPAAAGSSGTPGYAHHTQIAWEPLSNHYYTATYAHIEHAPLEYRVRTIGVASASALSSTRQVLRRYHFGYLNDQGTQNQGPGGFAPLARHSFLSSMTLEGSCPLATEGNGEQIGEQVQCQEMPTMKFGYQGTGITVGSTSTVSQMIGNTPLKFVDPFYASGDPSVFTAGSIGAVSGNTMYVDPNAGWADNYFGPYAGVVDVNNDGLPDVVEGFSAAEYLDVADINVQQRGKIWLSNGLVSAGSPTLSFQYGCADVGALTVTSLQPQGYGGNYFFSDIGGVTLSASGGTWGSALAMWSSPNNNLAALTLDTNVDPARISIFCPDAATNPSVPMYRWVSSPTLGWVDGGLAPSNAKAWFADVDADGFLDEFVAAGDYRDTRFASSNIAFSRRTATASANAALTAFSESQIVSGPTPVTQFAPVAPAAEYENFAYADVTGDGIVDLVWWRSPYIDQNNEFQPGVAPLVRAGDGRGNFGCSAGRDPAASCTSFAGIQTNYLGDIETIAVGDSNNFSPGYFINVEADGNDANDTPWRLSYSDDHAINNQTPHRYFFHDVTGDGLADIVWYDLNGGASGPFAQDPSEEFAPFGDPTIRLWINMDGHNFVCANPANHCAVGSFSDTVAEPTPSPALYHTHVSFADMDANGVDDLVVVDSSGIFYFSFVQTTSISDFPRAPRAGLLTSIDNGLGATTQVSYATIQELDLQATQQGRAWTTHSPLVVPVVQQLRTQDTDSINGIPNVYTFTHIANYQYSNPAYDPWNRRFSGFQDVQRQDEGSDAIVDSIYWYSPCEYNASSTAPFSTLSPGCMGGGDNDALRARSGMLIRQDVRIPDAQSQQDSLYWLSSTVTTFPNATAPAFGHLLFAGNSVDYRDVRDVGDYSQVVVTYDTSVAPAGQFDQIAPDGTAIGGPPGDGLVTQTQVLHDSTATHGIPTEIRDDGLIYTDATLGTDPSTSDSHVTDLSISCTAEGWFCAPSQVSKTLVGMTPHVTQYSYTANCLTLVQSYLEDGVDLNRYSPVPGAPSPAQTTGFVTT